MRYFTLTQDGALCYYKDKQLLRGQINLCKDTRVVKSAKDKFEIQCPQRTFYLSETDKEKQVVDFWIEKITEVIDQLKNNNPSNK